MVIRVRSFSSAPLSGSPTPSGCRNLRALTLSNYTRRTSCAKEKPAVPKNIFDKTRQLSSKWQMAAVELGDSGQGAGPRPELGSVFCPTGLEQRPVRILLTS